MNKSLKHNKRNKVTIRRSGKETKRTFSIDGSAYIGVFAISTESVLLLPSHISDILAMEIGRALKVKALKTSVAETSLIGCLAVGNSNGFIFSPYTLDSELQQIEDLVGSEGSGEKITRLPERDRLNAVGTSY